MQSPPPHPHPSLFISSSNKLPSTDTGAHWSSSRLAWCPVSTETEARNISRRPVCAAFPCSFVFAVGFAFGHWRLVGCSAEDQYRLAHNRQACGFHQCLCAATSRVFSATEVKSRQLLCECVHVCTNQLEQERLGRPFFFSFSAETKGEISNKNIMLTRKKIILGENCLNKLFVWRFKKKIRRTRVPAAGCRNPISQLFFCVVSGTISSFPPEELQCYFFPLSCSLVYEQH